MRVLESLKSLYLDGQMWPNVIVNWYNRLLKLLWMVFKVKHHCAFLLWRLPQVNTCNCLSVKQGVAFKKKKGKFAQLALLPPQYTRVDMWLFMQITMILTQGRLSTVSCCLTKSKIILTDWNSVKDVNQEIRLSYYREKSRKCSWETEKRKSAAAYRLQKVLTFGEKL